MHTTVVVIGAGHGGLAMSRLLSDRSIDHVVLERGEVANAWRTERWDSLRLLTPNWQSRLPGYAYAGDDPDGYMTAAEVVDFMSAYAKAIAAPVLTGVTVTSVRYDGDRYTVMTDQDVWDCQAVVLASGAFNIPRVPDCASALPDSMVTVTTKEYRNPDQLPEGGVLVAGASASGVQIAHELAQSGRSVTMAVGEHVRGPRTYRGHDIHFWMEATGLLDERYDQVDDLVRARSVPSMQLAGTPSRDTFDLNSLTDLGVKLVGRLAGIRDGRLQFSGSLRNKCELADLKLDRLLDAIDEWASFNGLDDVPPERFPRTVVAEPPVLGLDLGRGDIQAIVWATGYRPDYSWLDMPVLDHKGMVRHDGGVAEAPGMYLLGLPFLRRRKSSFIDGGRADAEDLILELAAHLDRQAHPVG